MVITITDVVYTDMLLIVTNILLSDLVQNYHSSFQTFKSSDFKEKNRETVFEELSFNDREVLFSFNIAV